MRNLDYSRGESAPMQGNNTSSSARGPIPDVSDQNQNMNASVRVNTKNTTQSMTRRENQNPEPWLQRATPAPSGPPWKGYTNPGASAGQPIVTGWNVPANASKTTKR